MSTDLLADVATVLAGEDLSLADALVLDAVEERLHRNLPRDINGNGRSFGGNAIALALLAASRTVDAARPAAALQVLFLRGIRPGVPVDYLTSRLQDGKQFSARHVRATQDGVPVLDAHASFAVRKREGALAHADPIYQGTPPPEDSAPLASLSAEILARLGRLGNYAQGGRSYIDFRMPRPAQILAPEGDNRFEFWVRARPPLPAGDHIDEVLIAYLTDWWINYTSVSAHLSDLEASDGALYIASLNHSIWFYERHDPREWMLFVCDSPRAGYGRGLSIAKIYNPRGVLIAVASQECLMASRLA